MQASPRYTKRLLDRLDRRLKRSRPASVLILVVALLVLMALIGTAFITTAGTDRFSAAQHSYNTEIDLLVEGVVNMCEGSLLGDIVPKGQYRHPSYGYMTGDHPESDTHLASRTPEEPPPGNPYNLPPNLRLWRYTSGAPTAPVGPAYEMPWSGTSPPAPAAQGGAGAGTLPNNPYYNARQFMQPTFIDLPQPDGTVKPYPALVCYDPTDTASVGKTYLAADADGDGIADAPLFRLTPGQINNVTYYAAVRIVDNAAAINANVALKSSAPDPSIGITTYPAAPVGDFFPTHIDLAGILFGNNAQRLSQLNSLFYHRLTGLVNANPAGAGTIGQWNAYQRPWNDPVPHPQSPVQAQPRADHVFSSPQDMLWHMLGRRLENPGYHEPVNGQNRYSALGVGDQARLALGFCVADSAGGLTPIEQILGPSLDPNQNNRIARYPYLPNQVDAWFNNNFAYDPAGGNNMPLRSILVTRNPTHNFAPVRGFNPKGRWTPGAEYGVGDWVWHEALPVGPNAAPDPTPRAAICLRAHVAEAQPAATNPTHPYNAPTHWAVMPWSTHPTRLNINTASFEQLWANFFAVMRDARGVAATAAANGQQFRNPIRKRPPLPGEPPGPAGVQLTARQVAMMRAAIAAVNAIDLRDPDGDVTSRTIELASAVGGPSYRVDVFGTEPQVYLTYAFVDADAHGRVYVALEFYNPYDRPVFFTNWRLGWMERDPISFEPRPMRSVADLTDVGRLDPGQRVVIESNRDMRPEAGDFQGHMAAPDPDTRIHPSNVQALEQFALLGSGEMYLLRPRRADGARSQGVRPDNADPLSRNQFNEAAAPLEDLVPADQLDFNGVSAAAATDGRGRRWHYARAFTGLERNKNSAWHCVWPGRYDPRQGTDESRLGLRHEGWRVEVDDPNGMPPQYVTAGGIGKFKESPQDPDGGQYRATYNTRALQLASPGMAGPNPAPLNGTAARFPYGGFARTGDVMQVPFIGGYRIRQSAPGTAIYELHSVTMDSLFGDDADPNNDVDNRIMPPAPKEQIGRFCPIEPEELLANRGNVNKDPLTSPDMAPQGSYGWALDLMEFFSVGGPQDDFMPNVDPINMADELSRVAPPWDVGYQSGDPTVQGGGTPKAAAQPQPVANGQPDTNPYSVWVNRGKEDAAAYHGRININTASWKVLSTVPFILPAHRGGNVAQAAQDNVNLARTIVAYRDYAMGQPVPRPFRHLWELQLVPGFREAMGDPLAKPDFGPARGDLSTPFRSATADERGDGVVGDFENRFAMLNRLSNLLTTQSDSYTVYVTVQGWRNAGSPVPELVAVRRAALIIDRSTVVPLADGGLSAATRTPVKHKPMSVNHLPLN